MSNIDSGSLKKSPVLAWAMKTVSITIIYEGKLSKGHQVSWRRRVRIFFVILSLITTNPKITRERGSLYSVWFCFFLQYGYHCIEQTVNMKEHFSNSNSHGTAVSNQRHSSSALSIPSFYSTPIPYITTFPVQFTSSRASTAHFFRASFCLSTTRYIYIMELWMNKCAPVKECNMDFIMMMRRIKVNLTYHDFFTMPLGWIIKDTTIDDDHHGYRYRPKGTFARAKRAK